MSTRAHVGFYNSGEKNLNNFQSLLYHHSDGYPSYMIPDMATFLIDFDSNRGIGDLEYAAANLIVYWRLEHLYSRIEMINSGSINKDFLKSICYLGLGICKEFHCDIAYYYAIYSDGIIEVYNNSYDEDINKWKKIGVTSIKELAEGNPQEIGDKFEENE